jgi:ribosomal protein S6--L-glutamate ligase
VLQGIPSLASPEAIDLAKNKFNAQLVLAATGIRTPRSVLETAAEPTHLEEVLGAVEPDADRPVIIKRNVGTNGIGVELFTNRTFAMAGLAAHPPTQTGLPSIIQEFIPPTEERPFDLRLVTVGQVVVAAMKRIASEGEFRSNIAQGGTGHEIQPTIKELKAAESTSKVINSDVLGIDIMLDNSEPLVIEVNVSPGFYIETVSGVNLPRLIAKAAIEKALKARSPSGSR